MDFSIFDIAIFVITGILAGISAGLFGIGGGVIIVPTLIFFLDFDIKHAIGISIVQMVFSSIFGSMLNLKNKNIELRDALLVGIGGAIGAQLSGVVLKSISSNTLNVIFLILLCLMVYTLFNKSKNTQKFNASTAKDLKSSILLIICGAITGAFAISLGIGGGILLTPLLSYFLNVSTKKSVGISLFFVMFSSISGSISLYREGFINLSAGSMVGIGSIIGVSIGIFILKKIGLKAHTYLIIAIYLLGIFSTAYKLI